VIEPQPFAGKFAEQRARERADAIRWRLDQLRPQHRRRPIRRGHYHKFRNEQGGHLKITGPAA
jgi:hypothetical protein